MERTEIIKALECCSTPSGKRCENCPKVTEDALCMYRLSGDALALIKELTQEVEKLTSINISKDIIIESINEVIKQLNKDNETLKDNNEHLVVFLAEAKADTVREMQERFKERIKGIYLDEHEANFILDQIANELSNSKDCPDCKHFIGCEPSTAGVCDGFEKREEKRDD